MNSKYGEKLFQLLPEIYKHEDSLIKPSPYPLRRYLSVLGSGMDELERGMIEYKDLKNIDKCPDHLLDIACNFYDFKFPANTSPETKRRMLKVFPNLYQNKGTRQAFIYLVRAMFGITSEIEVYTKAFEEGMDLEELRKIFLKVQVDDSVLDLNNKMANFETYAEIIRPVNRRFIVSLSTLFTEELPSGWANIQEVMKVYTYYFQDDNEITERLNKLILNEDKLAHTGGLIYNIIESHLNKDVISLALEHESVDLARYITKPSKLNQDLLNLSFILSVSNVCIEKLKDLTEYDVKVLVDDSTDLTQLHYLESTYNRFDINEHRLRRDRFTGASAIVTTNTKEQEVYFKPKTVTSDLHTLERVPESYSKINKSVLNNGIVLTHKKHCDIIRVDGIIQQIV